MPAISKQMSRSSSTMRMSWAMTLQTVRDGLSGSLCGCRMWSSRRDFLRVTSEYQTDARAATLAVVQHEITAVIFHDLLDDGEAEACALAAGRHIRLGEALAPLFRQTFAIFLDDNAHGGVVVAQGERDFPWRERVAGSRFPALDRLGRVLEDVGQHLRDLATVADQRHGMIRQGRDIADLRIAVALQEQRLLAEFLGILGLHRRARHAGERRELVDHAADVAHLADDGVGADREGFRILLDLLQITALQPLGGKLDRRQRVLDLVRDAPRHIAPRRHALRCRISTWPWVTRSGRSAACSTRGTNSGITLVRGRPSTPSSGNAKSSSAERLLRVIVPASSTLSPPAETPARTASVRRRL